MKGFSAEPGERSAARHVDGAGALARRDSRRCRPGRAPRRSRCRSTRMAAESCGAEPLDALAHQRLEARLQARVDGERDGLARPGRSATAASAAWAASIGKGRRAVGHRLGLRGLGLGRRDEAARHARGRARGRGRAARVGGEAVGTARLRRLRQRDEERRLGEGQALRLAAEIGEARRARALEVAAIGREREVEVEDLVLRAAAARAARRARSGAASPRACAPRAARAGAPPAWSASSRRRRRGRAAGAAPAARSERRADRCRDGGRSARPRRP